jgi:putative membrane protein
MLTASALTASALTTPALTAMNWHGGPPFAFFPLFFLIPIFWILVIGLIIFLVSRRRRAWWRQNAHFGPGNGSWSGSRSAEATLAERFAQGDIDEVEYRARLEVLRANREPNPR